MDKFLNFIKPRKEMRAAGIFTLLVIPIIIHFFVTYPEDTLWMKLTSIVANVFLLFLTSFFGAAAVGALLYFGLRLCMWLIRDNEIKAPEMGIMMIAAFPLVFCALYVWIMVYR